MATPWFIIERLILHVPILHIAVFVLLYNQCGYQSQQLRERVRLSQATIEIRDSGEYKDGPI